MFKACKKIYFNKAHYLDINSVNLTGRSLGIFKAI